MILNNASLAISVVGRTGRLFGACNRLLLYFPEIIRIKINENIWVSQTNGIHSFEFGEKATFVFNAKHCLYFGDDDKLIEL